MASGPAIAASFSSFLKPDNSAREAILVEFQKCSKPNDKPTMWDDFDDPLTVRQNMSKVPLKILVSFVSVQALFSPAPWQKITLS